ncbi:integral membrane protein AefA [Salmonella enterica subsp. enterica]|uniref:Integral membrane protein AefA n=1 Tax=Salmonella enterica I TaxID=59201 RepID=A0A3S4INH7_SALET|nr:integral membrane protein AefA [Salmonella enterica subsp. enterica]
MPAQLTSHWRRQIVRISLALLPLHFWSVVAELSPLNLMDDVLGQAVIFLNLLVITLLVWPLCRESWRDKESHGIRLVTVTILFHHSGGVNGINGDRLFLYHAAPGGALD